MGIIYRGQGNDRKNKVSGPAFKKARKKNAK